MRTLILERHFDVNEKDVTDFGLTPLHWSARKGHVEACNLLIRNGANINAKTTYGYTPLMWAARKGHSQVVKLLVRKSALLDVQDESKFTALHHATREGDLASVEILLAAGASTGIHDECGKTAAFYCMNMSFVDLFDTYEEKRASGKRVSSEVYEDGAPIKDVEWGTPSADVQRANQSLVEDYLQFCDFEYLASNGVLLFDPTGQSGEAGRVIFSLRSVPVGQKFCTERGSWLFRIDEEKVKLISAGTTFEVPVPSETFPVNPDLGKNIIVDGLSFSSPCTSPLGSPTASPIGSPTTSPLSSRRTPSDTQFASSPTTSPRGGASSSAGASDGAVATAMSSTSSKHSRARGGVHLPSALARLALAGSTDGDCTRSQVGGTSSAKHHRRNRTPVDTADLNNAMLSSNAPGPSSPPCPRPSRSPKNPRTMGVSLSRKLTKNARKKMKRRKELV